MVEVCPQERSPCSGARFNALSAGIHPVLPVPSPDKTRIWIMSHLERGSSWASLTLKQGFDFGEVARRGLGAAHGELLEKALAYNLCHLARMRRAKEEQAKAAANGDDEPALAQAA